MTTGSVEFVRGAINDIARARTRIHELEAELASARQLNAKLLDALRVVGAYVSIVAAAEDRP